MNNRSTKLFYILGSFFIANAILAEFIGVKIFSLEETFGLSRVNISILGIDNLSFNLTAGVLLWPVVFIMTDIINEYYGKKGVRFLSFTAAGLILYAYAMVFISINLKSADFWIFRDYNGIRLNMDDSFNAIFGQGMWIIAGSLVAFLVGQLIDVFIFRTIKGKTGSTKIWMRATGSTLISQLIDSFVVLFIAFYLGAGWSMKQVIAIGIVNYIYKFIIAVVLTPVLYIAHFMIDKYLGKEEASKLAKEAMAEKVL